MYSKYIVICTNNDYSNYGNRLQNYALSQMMKQYGMPVTTVRAHVHWLTIPDMIWGRLKEFVRPFKRTLLSLTDINQRRISHCEHFTTTMVPDDIISISPATKNRIDSSMLCVVVLGSDQIWNYHWQSSEGLELYLGSFAPRGHVISYAASFGVSEIEDERVRNLFREYLPRISSISVREDRGRELVKELSGEEATVVLDPTLMIDATEWLIITKDFVPENDRYILTYFLGKPSPEQEEIIHNKAKSLGCRVRRILDRGDPETYVAGPEDFVELFSKAQYVFTDSYHACCFSIIFNKQFKVFNRAGFEGKVSMNSRMETLFRLFDLSQTLGDDSQLVPIDYNRVNQLLTQHRAESQAWLDNALKKVTA